MALNIKLNFDDCYEIASLTKDKTLSTFSAPLKGGGSVLMGVEINDEGHPLIPGVYNLAFGPLIKFQQIDDSVKVYHKNYSKLFSTILLCGVKYLAKHKSRSLGVNGSNDARTYMYYRCLLQNLDYLNKFLLPYGVNYYVRVLKINKDPTKRFTIDFENWKAIPERITPKKPLRHEQLFNYLIFKLRKNSVIPAH